MTTQTEALKLALDWYDSGAEGRQEFEEMIKRILAQPEQEPVAPQFDIKTSKGGRCFVEWYFNKVLRRHDFNDYIQNALAADFACALSKGLYTTPPPVPEAHKRKPLTDEQIDMALLSFDRDSSFNDIARAIEAAHGIMSDTDGKE